MKNESMGKMHFFLPFFLRKRYHRKFILKIKASLVKEFR